MDTEKKYVVLKCPACGSRYVVPTTYKTKKCNKCNRVLRVATVPGHTFETASQARKSLSENDAIVFKRANEF